MDPRTLGARCDRCPLAKNGAPNRPVLGLGPDRPCGVVVVDAPSKDDAEKGRVLVGQVGSLFDQLLTRVGLARGKLFVVPAVACYPREKKDLDHLQRAVNACSPAFMAQAGKFAHLPTLALGKWALYAITGKDIAIEKARGFLRDVPWRQAPP